ncbi:MAG: hypothetical protein E5X10_04405, partial [Mesorhizobium sp.]
MAKGILVKFPSPEAQLKRAVRQHLKRLGFKKGKNGLILPPGQDKQAVRLLHGEQRRDKLDANTAFLARCAEELLPHFADGDEIEPGNIRLALRRVRSDTKDADLFR